MCDRLRIAVCIKSHTKSAVGWTICERVQMFHRWWIVIVPAYSRHIALYELRTVHTMKQTHKHQASTQKSWCEISICVMWKCVSLYFHSLPRKYFKFNASYIFTSVFIIYEMTKFALQIAVHSSHALPTRSIVLICIVYTTCNRIWV